MRPSTAALAGFLVLALLAAMFLREVRLTSPLLSLAARARALHLALVPEALALMALVAWALHLALVPVALATLVLLLMMLLLVMLLLMMLLLMMLLLVVPW